MKIRKCQSVSSELVSERVNAKMQETKIDTDVLAHIYDGHATCAAITTLIWFPPK